MHSQQLLHHQTLQHPHPQQQQPPYYDQQQHQQHQHQQQQHQQQQQQYNTLQYGRGCTAPPPLTAPHNRSMDQLESSSDQIQYNLSNCFPKSYTEYYQQHHQQQQQQQSQQQQQQQQQHQQQPSQQQSQKFHTNSASNAQLLNAIEHDYQPTYAVVERVPPPPPAPSSALLNTNPFLAASNFKKYDAAGDELLGSMQRSKRGKVGSLLDRIDVDKKFYSLKFPNGGNKLKKPAYNLNSSLGVAATATAQQPKCKRHHSFAGGSHGDIESNGKPMRLYDPPVYENVADKCGNELDLDLDLDVGGDGSSSSMPAGHHTLHMNHHSLKHNLNLATVQLHSQPAAVVSASHKKKHHHRQHQQKADASGAGAADFQLMEPERLSIYRSDSGISNSSYESQLPALGQRTPKPHKASAAGLNLTRKPLYMNVEGQQQQHQQQQQQLARAGSPAHINSSYESASSAPVTDPTSLSSSNSLYSSGIGTVSSRCNRHPQQQQQQQQQQQHHQRQPTPEITTPEDYEQYQLGHQPAHSASMLSVASSLSAASRGKCKPPSTPAAAAAASTTAAATMQQLPHRVGPHEQTQLLATNPFLALKRQCNNNNASSNSKANSSVCSKKLRRQTISDPYAHIKRHYADVDAAASAASNSNNNNNATEADSHCTAATSFTAAAAAAASEVEQQINNNNNNSINNGPGPGQRCGRGNHQQQMLMPNELLLQASQLTAVDCNHNLRYVPPLPTAPPPIQAAAGAYDCLVVRRPMRLPLRKHHTFHFQTTETANGKLQQLRRQLQQQQLERAQGPLIFRPLALSERHAFKPISPTPATTAAAASAASASPAQQQQLQQEQQQPAAAMGQLNPAASLEALEVLTKTHPDFMFARTKPQHEQIAATATTAATPTAAAADAAEEEDEDLGYSFCEEEYMVDDEEPAHDNDDDDDDEDEDEAAAAASHNLRAPPTTPAHSAAVANATAGALKYFMTQSYREVHI
ncbi:hypothetical protein AWZ03_012963 [Drosophila navojoa]|uniref:Uncharacterized protein n=2 Tax=Drosophila navojoa TaxID=7232 RepID=A0A484AW32_DRONA|nr:hypothetical protein AWZ03_012963 [Drosophila navojoa]